MEISRDEVRVMTVHGAKGLEASVVFLVDTTTSPSDTQRLRLINLPQGNAGPHGPGIVVWAGRKAEDPPAVVTARAAMLGDTEDEYRRLLYVAMTRAADRLIVGGCMPGNRKDVRPSSWYDLIGKGLERSELQLEEIKTSSGVVKRYSRAEKVAPATGPVAPAKTPSIDFPSWLLTPAQPERPAEGLLRPSDPADDDSHPVAVRRIDPRSRQGAQARHAGAPVAAIAARYRRRTPPRCRAVLPRPQRRRLDRGRTAHAGGKRAGADRGCTVCARLCAGQPAEVSIVGPAGPSGRAAGAGFRPDRPAGGDTERKF